MAASYADNRRVIARKISVYYDVELNRFAVVL